MPSFHCEIRPQLDPVAVAKIADGYGIDAAFDRWPTWSRRAVSNAAKRGREIIAQAADGERQ